MAFINRVMSSNFYKKYALPIVLVFTLLITVAGCKDNPHKVDVSDINVDITFTRFDKELLGIDTANMEAEFARLGEKYPEFFPSYYSQIITLDDYGDSNAPQILKEFLAFKPTIELNQTVQKKFGDVSIYNEGITDGFKHHRYYFPNDSLPDILYFTGILRYGSIYFGSKIAIGLDMYLGNAYPYASIADLPQYMIEKMKPECIVRNTLMVLASDRFNKYNKGKRFIDQMIYEGKLAYYMDAVMPEAPDSIKLAMTGRDVEWCEKSEWQIWQHLVDPKLKVLYNTEHDILSRYFEDGPFTNANNVPPNSAPRFAVWLGRQIVREYMDRSVGTTLADLMSETDSDKILRESKYKP